MIPLRSCSQLRVELGDSLSYISLGLQNICINYILIQLWWTILDLWHFFCSSVFKVVEFRIFVTSSPFLSPKTKEERTLSEYLIILVLSVLRHVFLFGTLKKKIWFFIWTCQAYFAYAGFPWILIFLFLFLVCHFQFSESVDCNLAAYMYLCLYPIHGTQPSGQK